MRAPWTVRVAAWSARHRWPVFALWIVATVGILVASFAVGGIETIDNLEDPNGPRLESEEAYEVLGAGEPVAASERLVVVLDGGPNAAHDAAFQQVVHTLATDLGAATAMVDGVEQPAFDSVVDPFSLPPEQAAAVVSPDLSTVQVVGNVPGERPVVEQKLVPVPAIVQRAREALPNARIHTISSTFLNRDINQLITDDLDGSLRFTVPVTFAILLIAFG